MHGFAITGPDPLQIRFVYNPPDLSSKRQTCFKKSNGYIYTLVKLEKINVDNCNDWGVNPLNPNNTDG